MGGLTSGPTKYKFSDSDDASPEVTAIEEFALKRGLSLNEAYVKEWHECIGLKSEFSYSGSITNSHIADSPNKSSYYFNGACAEIALPSNSRSTESSYYLGMCAQAQKNMEEVYDKVYPSVLISRHDGLSINTPVGYSMPPEKLVDVLPSALRTSADVIFTDRWAEIINSGPWDTFQPGMNNNK